ncbi:MAG TPA: carboxypeptidase regulatory-like domain-containing protein [Candidatus Binatia bacterium]|nr:carboxypeptidase regulatory-like domain-containing protein [Candidatus Binatia bacterium]
MKRTLAVVLCFVLLGGTVWAQFDSGQISGFVRDASGSVIVGANVTCTNEGNGELHRTTTNSNGYYVFPTLVVGAYTIAAEAPGFKKFVQRQIKLNAAAKVSVDADLAVGALADVVEVTASTSQVQAETGQVGRIIESRQIQDLTLNGRNPIYLALLKPGVRGSAIGTFDPDSVSNGGFSINGSRGDEYLVTVDGAVATRTRSSGSMLGAQDVDTVALVQVLTADYAAEYGRSSGGQIRFVTKSGGRDFHGNLVENFRNSALDANSWTRNKSPNPDEFARPPALRFNDYGFNIGGPIFVPHHFNAERSKLFFFWAEEWIKRRDPNTTTATVPTLAMRNGDFSELLNPKNLFFGRARTATVPGTKEPFPNNVIPQSLISPNGRALLNAFPLPTPGFQQGAFNWIVTQPHFSDLRKDTVKIDYLISAKHRLSFRGTLIPWNFDSPFEGDLDRFHALWSRPNRTAALSFTSTLSSTLLNEFTVSANSDGLGSIFYDPRCGAQCERRTYGINYPYLFPGTKWFDQKLPTLRIDGFSTMEEGPYPGTWAGFVYAWSNNTTKIIQNHTLKWGVFIERSGQNDHIQFTTSSPPATHNENGMFRFLDAGNPSTTGLAMANAIMGNFNEYAELGGKPITPWVATAFDWFAQDSWKAAAKLTIEAGVRHSIWPPWHSRWNSLAMFHPDFYDPNKAAVVDRTGGFIVSGDPYNGIVFPGSGVPEAEGGRFPALHTREFDRLFHGLPDGFAKTRKLVLQPRLGIAYAMNPKTAIRGGAGAFANRTMVNRDTALGGNAPFQPQQLVINGSADAPGGAAKRQFPFTMTIQDPLFKIPMAWNWNVTVERELPWATKAEVGYVGRRGIHNQRKRNINQLLPGTIQSNPGVNSNALRPFQGMGIISISENSGASHYNGLQLSVERRFSRGLQFGAAYTYSHNNDNGSDLTELLPNAYDDRDYYGTSGLDRPHVLICHYIYELPFLRGSGWLHHIIGNWEISGINQFQSGAPFSVRTGNDIAGVGGGSGSQFYNLVGDPYIEPTGFTDSAVWFNKAAFARPAAGTFGKQPKNLLYNPSFWSWDMGLRKNFVVTEHQKLQARWEVFNVLNHPNWGGADANPTSGTFGLVTGKTGDRRVMQLALKYFF